MKKSMPRTVAFLVALIILVSSSTAFAASSVSGQSSGGSAGIANCSGRVTVSQGGVFTNDSATAYTSADATGTYVVTAFVWYNDGTSEKSKKETKSVNNCSAQISVTCEGPNDYGNKGTGGHTYYSSIRGSWTGGTTKSF